MSHLGHSSVIAKLSLPDRVWPMPALIPWDAVNVDAWHRDGCHAPVESQDSTQWFAGYSHACERSLRGFVKDSPDHHIPHKCFGRGKHVGPQQLQQTRPPPRSSRPGEVQLRHDGVSLEVKRWFQQLRRLQSLKHALGSVRSSPHARAYQLDLWASILRSRGFAGGFRSWWERRPTRLLGSSHWLPDAVPTYAEAVQIYDDFIATSANLRVGTCGIAKTGCWMRGMTGPLPRCTVNCVEKSQSRSPRSRCIRNMPFWLFLGNPCTLNPQLMTGVPPSGALPVLQRSYYHMTLWCALFRPLIICLLGRNWSRYRRSPPPNTCIMSLVVYGPHAGSNIKP